MRSLDARVADASLWCRYGRERAGQEQMCNAGEAIRASITSTCASQSLAHRKPRCYGLNALAGKHTKGPTGAQAYITRAKHRLAWLGWRAYQNLVCVRLRVEKTRTRGRKGSRNTRCKGQPPKGEGYRTPARTHTR